MSRPGPVGLYLAYKLTKSSGDSIGSIVLSCPSASTCTVVASSFQQPDLSGAFVTEDGGRTWSASSMPTASPSQVQCFPNSQGTFVVHNFRLSAPQFQSAQNTCLSGMNFTVPMGVEDTNSGPDAPASH